jgi:hypothetical protein
VGITVLMRAKVAYVLHTWRLDTVESKQEMNHNQEDIYRVIRPAGSIGDFTSFETISV